MLEIDKRLVLCKMASEIASWPFIVGTRVQNYFEGDSVGPVVLNKWDLYIQDCRFPREDNSDQPQLPSRSQRWGNTKIFRKRPLRG